MRPSRARSRSERAVQAPPGRGGSPAGRFTVGGDGRPGPGVRLHRYRRGRAGVHGSQYALMARCSSTMASSCGTPKRAGRVNVQAEGDEQMMLAPGAQSTLEITRTKIRVRTAMAAPGPLPRRPPPAILATSPGAIPGSARPTCSSTGPWSPRTGGNWSLTVRRAGRRRLGGPHHGSGRVPLLVVEGAGAGRKDIAPPDQCAGLGAVQRTLCH